MENQPAILIVDDNAENLKYLEIILKGLNADVIKARSGAEALIKVSEKELALAILDVRMPVMSGYDLAIRLNENRTNNKIPVVFLTAYYSDEANLNEGYNSGAVDYLNKPVNSHILLCKVQVFLELYKQKHDLKESADKLRIAVDELLNLQKVIKASEEKYRMFIDLATDAFFQSNREGKLLTVNKEAERLSGYTVDELLSSNLINYFTAESIRERPLRFDLLDEGHTIKTERTILHKDGSQVSVEMNSNRLPDGTYQSFLRDITARLQAETAIRKSEKKLSDLMNNLQGMVFSCSTDAGRTMSFVSAKAQELTGYQPGDFINNNLISYDEIIHPDDRKMVWEKIQTALLSDTYFEIEYRIIRKSNEVRWVLERGRLAFSETGADATLEGFVSDITERKYNEFLQTAMFNITNAVVSSNNLNAFLIFARNELSRLLDTDDVELIFREEDLALLSIQPRPVSFIAEDKTILKKSLAERLRRYKKPVFLTREQVVKLQNENELIGPAPTPKAFLGTPLVINNKITGAVIAGRGEHQNDFNPNDLKLLDLVSGQVGLGIAKIYNENEITRSHKALVDLHMHIQEIREEERKKIALNLHDDLGQRLTALHMILMQMKQSIPKESLDLSTRVGATIQMLQETVAIVQRISAGLRPSILDVLGLVPAIQWQLDEFSKNTKIRCYARISPDSIDLDEKLTTIIFRVIQEALTNVARHSNATKVNLVMVMLNTQIQLNINDNGLGIKKEAIESIHSFGILGMRERVSSCGGNFQITGAASKGTQIKIIIPLLN